MSQTHETDRMLLEEVRRDVKDIRRVLYGNGELGIMGRIDRLEQSERADTRRGRHWWDLAKVFFAAVLGAAATLLTAGVV